MVGLKNLFRISGIIRHKSGRSLVVAPPLSCHAEVFSVRRSLSSLPPLHGMANSKFSYVRSFESEDRLPPQQWLVLSFSWQGNLNRFLDSVDTRDQYASVVSRSVSDVMVHFKEVVLSYCHFNCVHLVLDKQCTLYQRRRYKLLTYMLSCLSANVVRNWPDHFSSDALKDPRVVFDGNVHLFPTDQLLRDFLTMHQMAHHHVNLKHTLYTAIQQRRRENTVGNGVEPPAMNEVPVNKPESYYNEVLFSQFGLNYNNEPLIFKKGVLMQRRKTFAPDTVQSPGDAGNMRTTSAIVTSHIDFKPNAFWEELFAHNESSLNIKFNTIPKFEVGEKLLPHSWIVVRIDGKAFHKLSQVHGFAKPNDIRAINLMNKAAAEVMLQIPEIVISFGESDEFSFVVDRYSPQAMRHSSSLVSRCVSIFTAAYVRLWDEAFSSEVALQYSPLFDGRAVLYPTNTSLRDYLSWRQADCHINNMYNTAFWRLIQIKNCTNREAEQHLNGTFSADKRRIMMDLGVDYDKEPAIHRKGSILYRRRPGSSSEQTTVPVDPNANKKGYELKLWWNSQCVEIKNEKRKIRRKYEMHPTRQNMEELKKIETMAKKIYKEAKKQYNLERARASSNGSASVSHCTLCNSSVPRNIQQCEKSISSLQPGENVSKSTWSNGTTTATAARDPVTTTSATPDARARAQLAGPAADRNPWWDEACKQAKKERNQAKRTFVLEPSELTESLFKESVVKMKMMIKVAKKNYAQSTAVGAGAPLAADDMRYHQLEVESNGRQSDEGNTSATTGVSSESTHIRRGAGDDFLSECASPVKAFDDTLVVTNGRETGRANRVSTPHEDLLSAPDLLKNDASPVAGEVVTLWGGSERQQQEGASSEDASSFSDSHTCYHGAATGLADTSPSVGGGGCGGDEPHVVLAGDVVLCHVDIISNHFWDGNPHILGEEKSALCYQDE